MTIPEEWVTGYYVAVLRPSGGNPSYVPLIVRPSKGGRAPVLILGAVTTWQAYNWWGGKSLYPGSSVAGITASGTRAAATVSFDRPHSQGRGSGQMLRYEYQFVRWAEREARDVEYASDLDLVRHPELLRGRRLIVLPGHPEYWSREMRDALQAQVDAGVNVAFLCANEIYWQVRFDASPLGDLRNVTCYRYAERDPVAKTHPERATIRWRHLGLPEVGAVPRPRPGLVRPHPHTLARAHSDPHRAIVGCAGGSSRSCVTTLAFR